MKHVLIFCPQNSGAQHNLRNELGHLPDISMLLGTADGLQKTTRWVMQRGILGQFRGARSTLWPLNFSFPYAQLILFYFELLGATGNLTKEALE